MPSAASPSSSPRFDGIDVLRGYAILFVVLFHIGLFLYPAQSTPGIIPDLLFQNGTNGVSIFFAISGFVITYTSLRRFGSLAGMRPSVFYRLRFARIAPLLLALLCCLSLFHLARVPAFQISPQTASLPRALVAALTFHINWLEASHGVIPAGWGILWSLSVEEMFYLFFPLLCAALLRRRGGMPIFTLLLSIFMLLGPPARTVFSHNIVWQNKSYLSGMDGIALGCLCALLAERLQRDRASKPSPRFWLGVEAAGGALMLFVLAWAWSPWRWIASLKNLLDATGTDTSLLILGTSMVILGSVMRGTRGGPLSLPLRWCGQKSYEIYMTHEFVVLGSIFLYRTLKIGPAWFWVILVVLGASLLGGLVARLWSEPMNRRLRAAW